MEGVECAAAECAGGVAEDSAAEADMEEDSSCLGVSVAAGACVASSLSFSLSLSLSLSRSRSRSRALSLVLDLRAEFFFWGGAQQPPYGTGREPERGSLWNGKQRDFVSHAGERERETVHRVFNLHIRS